MTIEEYKQKFLELYNQLEKEHGKVSELKISMERNPFYDPMIHKEPFNIPFSIEVRINF